MRWRLGRAIERADMFMHRRFGWSPAFLCDTTEAYLGAPMTKDNWPHRRPSVVARMMTRLWQ